MPEPEVVAPDLLTQALAGPLTDAQRGALDRARVYFPYFALRVRFADARTRALLEPAGVATERLDAYFPALMDYAVRADWGRAAPPAPWEAPVAA
jgi:hypothetical protein